MLPVLILNPAVEPTAAVRGVSRCFDTSPSSPCLWLCSPLKLERPSTPDDADPSRGVMAWRALNDRCSIGRWALPSCRKEFEFRSHLTWPMFEDAPAPAARWVQRTLAAHATSQDVLPTDWAILCLRGGDLFKGKCKLASSARKQRSSSY